MQMQIFDTITSEYLQATQSWFGQVETVGVHLMVILCIIQFTLKISKNILTGEGNLMGMVATAIKHIVIMSVLYYLILNAGTLLPELFNSFSALGVAGSSITSLDPSSVVSEGLSIASAIIQGFNTYGVLTNIAFALFGTFCCVVIVICYGLIAADLMITLIESYFLVAVSSLFVAFGSTSYTLPMAREYLGMAVGVGIKLMMLYVMIAIGVGLGNDWAQLISQAVQAKDWTTYLGVAVGAIIYYLIVKTVPSRIASAASQAFAISHMNDASAATVSAITNTAAVMTGGWAAAGKLGNTANWLHKAISSTLPGKGGSSGSEASNKGGNLASNMLTHFGGSSGGGLDVAMGSAKGSGSVITPSVIHLPGPESKGQSDLFQSP